MDYKIRIYLKIESENTNPDDITKITGIEPSEIIRKGSPKKTINGFYDVNKWILESIELEDSEFEIHIENFLKTLDKSKEQLKSITKKFPSTLVCVIHCGEYVPAIFFERDVLKRITDYNFDVDFDIYR